MISGLMIDVILLGSVITTSFKVKFFE